MAIKIGNLQRQVDQLTKLDYEIFKRGASDANWITDYYFRTSTSGTYWRRTPEPYDEERALTWSLIYKAWEIENSPPDVFSYQGRSYKIQTDDEGYPIFWDHHGWLFQPWQLIAHHSPQPDMTIISGFGVGKTALIAMSLATLAITIPHFRGFAIAPQMRQAMEVYNYLMNFTDSPYFKRFVWRNPTRPNPLFEIRNSYVGISTIEIISIESDPEKVRTLEGDVVFLDQAEKFEELEDVTRDVGSRLRGQINGRPRMGRMVYVANAGNNPALWMRYDMQDHDPVNYLSLNPDTRDNPYLTKRDIENLKRRIGGTQQDIDQWMAGKRPMGRGEHFSPEVVQKCTDQDMNELMDAIIEGRSKTHLDASKYIKRKEPSCDIYHWEMPPDHEGKRQYIVIADPGQSNPPYRNSPIIMVWDVTDFPKSPATLRAFHWVFAGGSYEPFLVEYERMVRYYRAQMRNAFDSTGTQKGFDELYFSTHQMYATGLNMAGTGKAHALNAAKFFMAKGLIRFPYIPHLANQLTNYTLPDTKIRQDLVACVAMSALFMQQYFYVDIPSDEDEIEYDNAYKDDSRYQRHNSHRYGRSQH